MLRGAQKQMIVIRTRDSRLFEEAYFVVRKPRAGHTACKQDMLWEANRIIERSLAAAAPTEEGGTLTVAENAQAQAVDCSGAAGDDPSGQPVSRRRFLLLSRTGVRRGVWFLLGFLCGGGAWGLLRLLI